MSKYKGYLSDLGVLLLEDAMKSVESATKARGTDEEQFELGCNFAYFSVIDLITKQAKAFGIPLEDLRLEGVRPYRDLLVKNGSD